jgi:hypothetical protein
MGLSGRLISAHYAPIHQEVTIALHHYRASKLNADATP